MSTCNDISNKYVDSLKALGVEELRKMKDDAEYRNDCILSGAHYTTMLKKKDRIEDAVAAQAASNQELIEKLKKNRERYLQVHTDFL